MSAERPLLRPLGVGCDRRTSFSNDILLRGGDRGSGWLRCLTRALAALAVAIVAPTFAHAESRWLETWATSPAQPQPSTPESIRAALAAPIFNNQTIVQVVRVSAGGHRLRVRFTNEYGSKPLVIGAASISEVGADGVVQAGTERPLLFSGRPSAVIPPGAPWVSDPLDLPTAPLANLRIALFVPGLGITCTCHMNGLASTLLSPPGDYTQKPFTPSSDPKPSYRAFISAVEVESSNANPVIVVAGDSITDGFKSSLDTNHRWPDRLAERLVSKMGAKAPAVVNAAISGNRLLFDGYVEAFGQNTLARFDRDVLSAANARYLVLLEGINDIGIGASPPSSSDIIDGYRQVIARAHAHGMKVILSTILPYEGARYYRPEGDKIRQAVNAWIRNGAEFDGVIDLDQAMRDPAQPTRLRPDLQSGDWLHPNDAGYRVMGDAVKLKLFE